MKNGTFKRLLSTQELLSTENAKLTAHLGAGKTTHSFMHYPYNATTAAGVVLDADVDQVRVDKAVRRVIAAYQKACENNVEAAGCMWTEIESRQKTFTDAMVKGDVDAVASILKCMFQTEIIWGLGKYDTPLLEDVRTNPHQSHVQLRITDALISLAQAVAAYPVGSIEQQGIANFLNTLKADLPQVFNRIQEKTGLDVSSPRVGGAYGALIDGRFVTIDGLLHGYSLHRLVQLGMTQQSKVVEIGGGFGCLAELVIRAGYRDYTIIDLPWVNAIQGYYTLMSCDPDHVSLYGENNGGSLRILPFWEFEKIADRSIDLLLNCDSLPEMGNATATGYIREIGRVLRGSFLSINQEAEANNAGFGNQNNVPAIVAQVGGLKRIARSLYWMRQGYVEELYVPS